MQKFFGLTMLTPGDIPTFLAVAVVAAVVVGWVSDAIMGSAAYGVIGNAMLALLGIFTALAGWAHMFGPVTPANLPYVGASACFGVLVFLMMFALFKRAVE